MEHETNLNLTQGWQPMWLSCAPSLMNFTNPDSAGYQSQNCAVNGLTYGACWRRSRRACLSLSPL